MNISEEMNEIIISTLKHMPNLVAICAPIYSSKNDNHSDNDYDYD